MRQKIKDIGSKERKLLKFGSRYSLSIYGASFSFDFKFTRKNMILMEVVAGKDQVTDRFHMSKKQLKKLINDDVITQWVVEY